MRTFSPRVDIRQLVDKRGIPDALSFEELIARVEQYRGIRIRFQESPALDGARVCGAWTGDGTGTDTIHLPSAGRLEIKFFIACHELGHMLDEPVGNEHQANTPPEVEEFLASVINPDRRVAYAYARSTFSDQREAAAEAIGDQLALRILRARRRNATRDFQFERVFG